MIRNWLTLALLLVVLFLGWSIGRLPPPPPVAIRVDAEPNISLEIMRMQHEKEMQELRNKRPQILGRARPLGYGFASNSFVNTINPYDADD